MDVEPTPDDVGLNEEFRPVTGFREEVGEGAGGEQGVVLHGEDDLLGGTCDDVGRHGVCLGARLRERHCSGLGSCMDRIAHGAGNRGQRSGVRDREKPGLGRAKKVLRRDRGFFAKNWANEEDNWAFLCVLRAV